MINALKKYNDIGYLHIKSAFSKEWCERAKKSINDLEPKVYLPFSDIPWGFGQLFVISPFDEILEHDVVKEFCSNLFNTDKYKFNHLLVSNKSSFIGPEEMWHQEWPNMGTFAPGCSADRDWKKVVQVFIAVDNM